MREIYRKINELLYRNEKFAVATIVRTEGSTPRNVGAKMIITEKGGTYGTIGGGNPESIVINDALKTLEDGKPRFLSFRLDKESEIGAICGGNMDIYIEPIERQFAMILIGGGHVGKSLIKMASMLGFSVTVIEPTASKEQFPDASIVISKKGVDGLADVNVTSDSCIVIATGSHETDELVLRKVLDYKVAYLGMIGSRNKIKTIFKNLVESGIPKEKLSKIHAPIGLDVGAETPAEIAVSVMAEIISTVRGGSGKPLSQKASL